MICNCVYYRCIGTLLNTALEEIIQRIVGLADISAEAAGQFSSLLSQIKTRAPELFSPESEPSRYVKRWAKFLELVVVLDASLRETGASAVIYGGMEAVGIAFEGVAEALSVPTADLRLFGKPEAFERRRMGVATARGATTDEARDRAREAAGKVRPVRA